MRDNPPVLMTRLAVLLLAVLLAGSACSSTASDSTSASASADEATTDEATTDEASADVDDAAPSEPTGAAAESDPATAGSDDQAESARSDVAQLIEELPPAPVGFPTTVDRDEPTRVTIESLGIDGAPIIDVGVESNGDMEVPPADQVGWYRYSPLPGQEGSSILAAHIAFDGQNGVFVRLADIEIGAEVEVQDEAGLTRRFRVESVERYAKEQLPEDVVYARQGTPRLVLVTCGGRFDTVRNSYDDNVVVVAVPVS